MRIVEIRTCVSGGGGVRITERVRVREARRYASQLEMEVRVVFITLYTGRSGTEHAEGGGFAENPMRLTLLTLMSIFSFSLSRLIFCTRVFLEKV